MHAARPAWHKVCRTVHVTLKPGLFPQGLLRRRESSFEATVLVPADLTWGGGGGGALAPCTVG